jgi:putative flavoprotein involved in K+ transport
MHRTSVVIIGAGQAGLAVSSLLTAAAVDHVVLERGRVGESWRSQRWDSLRLLTPNWMTRLPDWSYSGRDPEGFMTAGSVAAMLACYAELYAAPVVGHTTVISVRRVGDEFSVRTDNGTWIARAVVVATGHAAESWVPDFAGDLASSVTQIYPDRYRNPADVPEGRVLVVGASATGVQLADELRAAGRDVLLSVGGHTRLPRRYRGMDIMWWLNSIGALDRVADPAAAPRPPERSLQLVGSDSGREVDLDSLALRGIKMVGRVGPLDEVTLRVTDDLAASRAAADAKLHRLLQRFDAWAIATGLHGELGPATRPAPALVAAQASPTRLRMGRGDIGTVVWATGYRRRYPWLQVPVLDARGEIAHVGGRTAAPGLLVVGMAWQTRRTSTFIDGVRHDAASVVEHLLENVLGCAHARRDAS